MISFIARRLASLFPVILGVSFLIVLSTKLIPGSPAEMKSERGSPAEVAAINAKYGYDRNVFTQWRLFVTGAVQGDLGESWAHSQPVTQELRQMFPATIELALAATAIATLAGLVLGIGAAVRPRGLLDGLTSLVALGGISIPVFWLGLLLQLAIAPLTNREEPEDYLEPELVRTGLLLVDTALAGRWEHFVHAAKHLALPALALSTVPLATIARMTRASMLEALSQDFVRTAKAKGLSARAVVLKHALRNALIPIVTASGLHLAALLGGAVLTESVFSWPGVGLYIYESATKKDLPALQGAVLVVAVVYVLLNLMVDVSYGVIDPRVRET